MNEQIINARKEFDKLGVLYELSKNVAVKQKTIENVTCYRFEPKEKSNRNRQIIFLHGGCFVLGSIQSHQAMVSHLCEQLELPVIFIEYSLAPEKPFPAALDEIEKVYMQMVSRYAGTEFILMGDSAGGGLAISLTAKLQEKKVKPPAYLIMLSPWTDLTCTNGSMVTNTGTDPILSKKALQDYASMYVNGTALKEANPIEAISGKYPPTLILVSAAEILLDDGKILHQKIAAQQEKTKLSIYENQNHVWLLADIHSEQSKKAIKEIKEFINS